MSQLSRRSLLKKGLFGLAALPVGMGVLTSQSFAALPALEEDAPQAKAFNYVKVSASAASHPKHKADAFCDNCMFFKPADNGCTIFPRNSVEPKGWCQSWVKKP